MIQVAAIYFFLFVSVAGNASVYAKSPTIRALIATDTKSNLKQSVKYDAQQIEKFLNVLKASGMRVRKNFLSGENLTIQNLKKWIRTLPKHSNDTILFYYSGHGFRTKDFKSPWPILALQHGKENIPAKIILRALVQKSARFTLIVTDCCNGLIVPKSFGIPYLQQKSMYSDVDTKRFSFAMKQLFLSSKGLVFLTASQPGTNAIGFVPYGGLLTNSFLECLADLSDLPKSAVSWPKVLEATKQECESFRQTPYYEITPSQQ